MKYQNLIAVALTGIISGQAAAGTMGMPYKNWDWLVAGSVGPAWEDAGKTQTFYMAPNVIRTFAASKATHSLVDGELMLGAQRELPYKLLGQFGLAVGVAGDPKLSGNIWDDADPTFNNWVYSYKVQHTHIAAKGKVLADRDFWVMPWVSASIGVGFNRAYGFDNKPLLFQALPLTNFTAYTKTTFTYTVGAGIQKIYNQNWQYGIGYEFADWGQSQLHRASGQTLNSGLGLSHFYTNGFLFNLTYIA